MTGSVEVLVARITDGLVTRSSSLKSATLTSMSSITDSITRSQSPNEAKPSEAEIRANTSSRSSTVVLPRSTALVKERSTARRTPSADACDREATITSYPARAATSAIPQPMIPEPTIPTVRITRVIGWTVATRG